jgi:hypothetical protein
MRAVTIGVTLFITETISTMARSGMNENDEYATTKVAQSIKLVFKDRKAALISASLCSSFASFSIERGPSEW